MAAAEASRSAVMEPAPIQRETTTSDGYPIVQVSTDAAADAAWWASRCPCDIAIRSPAVKPYEAPASVRAGYVDLEMPSVVFVRAGMGLSGPGRRSLMRSPIWPVPTSVRHAATRPPGDGGRGGSRRHPSRLSRQPTNGRSRPPSCGAVETGPLRVAGDLRAVLARTSSVLGRPVAGHVARGARCPSGGVMGRREAVSGTPQRVAPAAVGWGSSSESTCGLLVRDVG
jgi:hypothetical protein